LSAKRIAHGVPEMGRVWLDPSAREAIADEAAKRRLRETGGPLFGYQSAGQVVLARALGPGPKARHRRTRLIPDAEHLQRAIDEIHAETEGRLSYIGEWHTHPLGRARPSATDEETAARIAGLRATGLTRPLVLIQSTKILHRHVQMGDLAAFLWAADHLRLEHQEMSLATAPSLD
jgi:integrative and conjugative element protein (TIGR02256 family)